MQTVENASGNVLCNWIKIYKSRKNEYPQHHQSEETPTTTVDAYHTYTFMVRRLWKHETIKCFLVPPQSLENLFAIDGFCISLVLIVKSNLQLRCSTTPSRMLSL